MTETANFRLELIKTLCSIISAVGVGIGAYSLVLQQRVWSDYHRRARIEKGVQLLTEFSKTLNSSTRSVQKLIETADSATLHAIYEGKPFEVGSEHRFLVQAALVDQPAADIVRKVTFTNSPDEERYMVSAAQSYALRWKIVSYLNALEIVCQAWMRDVGDREMLATEIGGLYDPQDGQSFCQQYRDKFNGDVHYPALTAFVRARPKPPPDLTTVGPPK